MIYRFKNPLFVSALFLSLLAIAGTGCNSETSSNTTTQPQQMNPKTSPTPPDNTNSNKPDFKYFSVIREFGGTDTAALFGILPSHSSVQFSQVTGPSFLGNAHVGILNPSTIAQFFLNSSQPMTEQEKDDLLTKYEGATFLYFEEYNSKLCSDTQFKINAAGTLDNLNVSTVFDFIAEPNPNGDCTYHASSFLTQD